MALYKNFSFTSNKQMLPFSSSFKKIHFIQILPQINFQLDQYIFRKTFFYGGIL